MKKIISIMLCVGMLLSFAACSGSENKEASAPTAEPTEAPTPEPTEAPTPELTEAPTPEPTAVPTPEPTAPSDGAISSDDLFGTINGDAYENRFLGIGCRLEGWHYASREEIAATYNLMEYIFSDDVSELIENNQSTIIMLAINANHSKTVTIAVENTIYMYGSPLSAEQYIDLSIPSLEAMLSEAGITDLSVTHETMTFLGSEKPCITITGAFQGNEILEKMVFLERGDYLAYVCFTVSNGGEIGELPDAFFSIM